MMQLVIKFVPNGGKDGGIIEVSKAGKKVGEIKYEDESDRKWLVMMLTHGHPNVSIEA